MSTPKTEAEKRRYIFVALAYFNIFSDAIYAELAKDQNISISAYLDKHLIPIIPELYKKKTNGFPWGNKEEIEFRSILPIYFNGDLTQTAWNTIEKLLKESEKIEYATSELSLGYPLHTAASAGNLIALQTLDAIYKEFLPKGSEILHKIHFQLFDALSKKPRVAYSKQQIESYNLLFDMCEKYAVNVDPTLSKTGYSNKQLNFKIEGMFFHSDKTTPLLDVFVDVCKKYVEANNPWAIHQLVKRIQSKGTQEDFEYFTKQVKLECNISNEWDLLTDEKKMEERFGPYLVNAPKLQSLEAAVAQAVTKYEKWYKNKQDHRGPNGFFSWFRHGKYGQDRAKALQKSITNCTIEEATHEINLFLTGNKTRYHRHSFASFLLDELNKLDDLPWKGLAPDTVSNRYDPEKVAAVLSSPTKTLD